jgi:DNA-binding CsgD family transcriptional regulator
MTGLDDTRPETTVRSGAPLFTFDDSQRIRSWNQAAEDATGIRAEEVVGRFCWEVLCAHDERGGLVCHSGCSFHRLLRESWPVAPATLVIRTATGPRRVHVPMIALRERELFAAVLLDPAAQENGASGRAVPDGGIALTPRQREVLAMLADGKQARVIAAELRLSEMTVRNHIRAILRELDCPSQLAAVARARRLGLA